jgi:precorrin-2/cobalt-factor-2 C20-methyltransferase
MTGTLYGLGVGPGDPELLTLKALRVLQACPVVAYPAPDHGQSFARGICAEHLTGEQTEVPIVVPMRVARFPAQEVYDEAAQTLRGHLDAGRDVAVLCEGDPFFYGSFMYLFQRLAADYRWEVVPGVSSLMTSAAVLGQPLAARNDLLTVVPGPSSDSVIRDALTRSDALAFIKVGRHFARLKALIKQAGMLDRAVYLERVSLEEQRILPLSEAGNDAPYFSMILIYAGGEEWVSNLPGPAELNS